MAETNDVIEQVIRPKKGWVPVDFRELWVYRELFAFLAWRDILVRYKQTVFGVLWAVIVPLINMVMFTVVFGHLAGMSENQPDSYYVITYAALIPWLYFSGSLDAGSQSLTGNAAMVTKIYFPRLIIPASVLLSGLVDMVISLIVLGILMLITGTAIHVQILLLPFLIAYAFLIAFGVSIWFAALNAKYRDVKHVVPFIVKVGVMLSPVGYRSAEVPEKWQLLYSCNPLVGLIETFRYSILGPGANGEYIPSGTAVGISVVLTIILVITGLKTFRQLEDQFADYL